MANECKIDLSETIEFREEEYLPHNTQLALFLYDGECAFCKWAVHQIKKYTGDKIKYAPCQHMRKYFPDISAHDCLTSVHLLHDDMRHFIGAGAIYNALAQNNRNFFWKLYTKSSIFKTISERGYYWVAHHRSFLFKIVRFLRLDK